MKKYVLLPLIVLAMGTTVWGTIASVTPPEDACACEDLYVHVEACLPYDCDAQCTKVCVRGNMVIVEMYYGCEDCKCGGATCIDRCVNIGEFCPGVYSVIVRIYRRCEDSCCCRRPRVCAYGTTFFRVGMCCAPAP